MEWRAPEFWIRSSPEMNDPMSFVSGPRQVGKTWLVRNSFDTEYFNFDTPEVKKAYAHDAYFFRSKKQLVVFNEIHKRRDWKKLLKGWYDSPSRRENFIITGSGRLEVFQKGGDSLQGRYESFHLMPIVADELQNRRGLKICAPRDWGKWEPETKGIDDSDLIRFGGFPQPYLWGSEKRLRKWLDEYTDRFIRGDVRDMTRVIELDKMDLFARILPKRLMSPLSLKSCAEDCDVSPVAIKTWINIFENLYYGFMLPPWSRRIERAVKKERKWYFFAWNFAENDAARFENYMAVQLYSACTYLRDQGHGRYELYYLRDQDHREVDFLICRNLEPVCLIETKTSEQKIPSSLKWYVEKLKIPGYLVYPDGPTRHHAKNLWSVCSGKFLKGITGLDN